MPDVVATAFVPGMPHLLAQDPAPSWKALADATSEVGRRIAAENPDVVVMMSTQWFTVLGHQFQADPNPSGQHIDENWYDFDFGDLTYDLRMDSEFVVRWAEQTTAAGMQSRLTDYLGFPIDTGTIVAHQLIDPHRERRLALVSCNLYADVEDIRGIGEAALRAAGSLDKRIAVVVVSGLSSGLIQRWIDPHEDRFEDPDHDRWNRRILDLLTAGDVEEVLRLRPDYAREAQVDSQLRALAFLLGTGGLRGTAEVLEYGPVWGTGAAVIYWSQ